MKEIELVKNFSTKIIPGPYGFTGKFYQPFKKAVIQMLCKLFQKKEVLVTLSNSFYEVTSILKAKTL